MLPHLEWEEKSPPSAGIDQLIPPPRPLGLRSTDSVVKGVDVDDLDLGGGEVRVEAFSVVEKVNEGRRLLLTPLSVDLSVDLINSSDLGESPMIASQIPFLSCWRAARPIPSHLVGEVRRKAHFWKILQDHEAVLTAECRALLTSNSTLSVDKNGQRS